MKAQQAQKVRIDMLNKETNATAKFIEAPATDDIIVSVKVTEKEIKAASIKIQTNNGTCYIRGFARKAAKGDNAGKWFFAYPSHKYNDAYVNDAYCDKEITEKINAALIVMLA